MAAEVISAKVTPQPVTAGARVKIAVGLRLYTWDVYNALTAFAHTSDTISKTKSTLTAEGYRAGMASGDVTVIETESGWRVTAIGNEYNINNVYIMSGTWIMPTGVRVGDIIDYYYRSAKSTTQTGSTLSLIRHNRPTVVSRTRGTATGTTVSSCDDDDYPVDGYASATDKWCVKRQE